MFLHNSQTVRAPTPPPPITPILQTHSTAPRKPPPHSTTPTPSNHRPFPNLENMHLGYSYKHNPTPSPQSGYPALPASQCYSVSAFGYYTLFSSASASFTAHNSVLIISVTSRVCPRVLQPGLSSRDHVLHPQSYAPSVQPPAARHTSTALRLIFTPLHCSCILVFHQYKTDPTPPRL